MFLFNSIILNAQWEEIADYNATSLAIKGDTIYVGNSEDVFVSTNNGKDWTSCGLQKYINCLSSKENRIYAGTENGIFCSNNNGVNWVPIDSGFVNNNIQAITNFQNKIIASTNYEIYVSTDTNYNWKSISSVGAECFTSIGNSIFAGAYGNVFISADSCKNWASVKNGLPSLFQVYSLTAKEENVYAGLGQGLYVSTDAGSNWNLINTNFLMVTALSVNGDRIFAGTWGMGVYISSDNGDNWVWNSPLRGANIKVLASNNEFLFAGESNYGKLYRISLSYLTSIRDISKNSPINFSLFQNYPNPFNPTTKIEYSIPKTSFVTLKVYDVLGREIATLVNEEKTIGKYNVEFNGINLSSGIYLYKIQAGNYSSVKKMILMK